MRIHSRGHNIWIDNFFKTKSDKKLNKFYLKCIVYHEGFHFVLHIVGKDHTVCFYDEQWSRNYIYEKKS
jgi:hypothetical protein